MEALNFHFSIEEKAILNKGELLGVNFWDVTIHWNSHLFFIFFLFLMCITFLLNKTCVANLSLVKMGWSTDLGGREE